MNRLAYTGLSVAIALPGFRTLRFQDGAASNLAGIVICNAVGHSAACSNLISGGRSGQRIASVPPTGMDEHQAMAGWPIHNQPRLMSATLSVPKDSFLPPAGQSSRIGQQSLPGVIEMPLPLRNSGWRSRGFTLVELLVVMAIIAILLGMLFPAIQSMRATARKSDCLNKIRQLGVATASYEGAQRHLPQGWIELFNTGPATEPYNDPDIAGEPNMHFRYGWSTLLLPYLEGDSLFRSYDPMIRYWGDDMGNIVDDISTVLPAYLCPSDSGDGLNMNWATPAFATQVPAKLNYGANAGVGDPSGGLPYALDPLIEYNPSTAVARGSGEAHEGFSINSGLGLFCCNSRTRIKDISDGQSHTVLYGERGGFDPDAADAGRSSTPNLLIRIGLPPSTLASVNGIVGVGGDGSSQLSMGPMWLPTGHPVNGSYVDDCPLFNTAGNRYNPYDYEINASSDYDGDGLNAYSSGFSSGHQGGANFVFADGSTRFVADSLDILTFQRILQRNDGQVVNPEF
jgi:prepilin-type N-terminal cleavage/methylation domain-containing protein/prepilin-type processing-associated H-X9-DG protein